MKILPGKFAAIVFHSTKRGPSIFGLIKDSTGAGKKLATTIAGHISCGEHGTQFEVVDVVLTDEIDVEVSQ